jgi:hypothetical protein
MSKATATKIDNTHHVEQDEYTRHSDDDASIAAAQEALNNGILQNPLRVSLYHSDPIRP